MKKQSQEIGVSGSLINQMMANNSSIPVVGQGATRMWYTDRSCYEVISVSEDGTSAVLEELDPISDKTKQNGEGHQNWILNQTGRFVTVEWRKRDWCIVGTEVIFTKKYMADMKAQGIEFIGKHLMDTNRELFDKIYNGDCLPRTVVDGITRAKKVYHKISIIFGRKDYHYDWSL